LLIVSHDKQAIISLCDRAILLSKGQLAMQGDPEAVMDFYNSMLADHQNQTVKQQVSQEGKVQTISGTGEVSFTDLALLDEQGHMLDVVAVGQQVTLRVNVLNNANIDELVLGYLIKNRLGQSIFGTNTYHYSQQLKKMKQGQRVEFRFTFKVNLGPGSYSIAIAAHSQDNHIENNYEWRDQAFIFNVINIDKPEFIGLTWLPPDIKVIK